MNSSQVTESYMFWLRRFVSHRRIFTIGAMAAVRDEAGRLLVMRRADDGVWDFPGGSMELGETLVQAVVRETAEETGLTVEPLHLTGLYTSAEDHSLTYPNGDLAQGWAALFECRPVGGTLHSRDGEARDLAWVAPEQLPFDHPLLKRMAADLRTGRKEAAFDPPGPVAGETAEYWAVLRPFIGHAPILLPGTAACIRDEQGRILLQKRSDCGLWGFPGGGQMLGESATQAVVREVYEETGLQVEPVRLIGAYGDPGFGRVLPNGDQVQPVVAFFEMQVVGGRLQADLNEALELAYFRPDRLPPMLHCCQVKMRDALVGQKAAFYR